MHISSEGLALIKSFEGLRLKAYKPVPSEKEYTVGYGHYGVSKDTVITEEKANLLLKQDMIRFELAVMSLLGKAKVNQHQFDALVSFAYNCGVGNLQKSTLLKLVLAGRMEEASNEFAKWNKITLEDGTKKVLDGLTRRREAERVLFMKPMPKPIVLKTIKEGTSATSLTKLVQAHVGVKVDGHFGPATTKAVKALQKKHGLKPDGIVGTATWKHIKH